jgi:hypothetical protein
MNLKSLFHTITLGVVVSMAAVSLGFAGQTTSFNGDRVTVAYEKSFEEVNSAVKSLVAKNGMMIMAEVN